jgi:hypothetical protein
LRGVWAATLILIRVFWESFVFWIEGEEVVMAVAEVNRVRARKMKFVPSDLALIP